MNVNLHNDRNDNIKCLTGGFDFSDIVAGEPTRLSVKGPFPPAPFLSAGDINDVPLVDGQLVFVGLLELEPSLDHQLVTAVFGHLLNTKVDQEGGWFQKRETKEGCWEEVRDGISQKDALSAQPMSGRAETMKPTASPKKLGLKLGNSCFTIELYNYSAAPD